MELKNVLDASSFTYNFPETPQRQIIIKVTNERICPFDLSKDSKLSEIPLYLTTNKIHQIKKEDNSNKIFEYFMPSSPFNLIRFPVKYLAALLINSPSVYQFELKDIGGIEIGKFFLKDASSGRILFLGVINKECVSFSTKPDKKIETSYNLDKISSELKQRKYPIKFYVDISIFTDKKYERFTAEIVKLVGLINQNPEFRVYFTGDVTKEFFTGFDFPKFASVIQLENFVNDCLVKAISKFSTSKLDKIKLSA